jgi:hypothetical protein
MQLEHGSFLSHLTLRCWHNKHGCFLGPGAGVALGFGVSAAEVEGVCEDSLLDIVLGGCKVAH